MKFTDLNLKPALIKALDKLGYDEMFRIQEEAWKILNASCDCILMSKTGSGKTLAYALPILQNININEKNPQAIILCPTRELARQVKQVFDQIGMLMSLKTVLLIGKESFSLQEEDLKQRCHVVIGTPGRVIEHMNEGNISSDKISFFVLDEADEMLNQDFEKDMVAIYDQLSSNVKTCLVSATYSISMDRFVKNAKRIEIEKKNDQIEQFGFCVEGQKQEYLLKVLIEYVPESCLIFTSTQQGVEELYSYLFEKNISVEKIHGGMDQEERFGSMDRFKKGDVRILVATDVASRGIDIEKVDMIINYELSKSKTLYTHRIGRSGRAFETGRAISLYLPEEEEYFRSFGIETKSFIFSKTLEDISCLSNSTKEYVDKTINLKNEVCTLFLNIGKDKKVRAGDIVGAFCQIEGVSVEDIGAIKVEGHQSFVDIYNKKEMLIINNVKRIKKKSVRIELAKRSK